MPVVKVEPGVRTRRRSRSRRRRRRRLSHLWVVGWLAVAVIGLFVFGAALAPYDPDATDIAYSKVGPIPGHPLGFDELGRGFLSRLPVRARSRFVGPVALMAVSTITRTPLALLAAWRRGWTDATLSAGFDIAFALPGLLLDADQLAGSRGMSITDAERLLHRIAATETIAAQRLLDSGVEPNFTREQAQVTACIRDIVTAGGIPTRASVRAHALAHARAALRPIDGPDPIIETPGLPVRIVSASPMTVVPGWLDRMDADPPLTGLLDHRIAYLRDAKHAMGNAARQHTRALRAVEHACMTVTSAPPPPTGAIDTGCAQRLAV